MHFELDILKLTIGLYPNKLLIRGKELEVYTGGHPCVVCGAGNEPRPSHMPGRHSTTKLHPSTQISAIIFGSPSMKRNDLKLK